MTFISKLTILVLLSKYVYLQNTTDISLTKNVTENEILTNNLIELSTLLSIPEQENINQTNNLSTDLNENLINTTRIFNIPKTCSEIDRDKLKKQPEPNSESHLKKCCPEGESSYYNTTTKYCDFTNHKFDVDIINAVLYDNCIEDNEIPVELDIIVGNPCNVSFIYGSSNGDKLYILQDGSLLILDEFGNQSMEIIYNYCLDSDYLTGELIAVVCVSSINEHISWAQTILFAFFMLLSIPCLICVAYIHFRIKVLRTVHGLSLGVMSSSLAIGYALHVYAQICNIDRSKVGYGVQYFILSYYFWMVMMCFNIVLTVWYFLPRYVTISRAIRYGRLAVYASIAFTIPMILVIITHKKKLPGMPSYFYQGWSDSVQASQKYFIPPVSFCLVLSFFLLIGAYFGFRQLNKIVKIRSEVEYRAIIRQNGNCVNTPNLDQEFLSETGKDAKCLGILLGIMSITWLLEVATFYSPGSGDHLAFMEITNGLQGLFILLIFIIGRDRRDIISRWWHDRGSHEIPPLNNEMTDMSGRRPI